MCDFAVCSIIMESLQLSASPTKLQIDPAKPLRSPYLQDTGTVHPALRLPRQLLDSLPAITPHSRVSSSFLQNNEGSDMFRAICERKSARERLEAMTNRIQSLRLAETRANKKLTEVRKLTEAKTVLRERKDRAEEERKRRKLQLQSDFRAARYKIESDRSETKERITQARESLLRLKRVTDM